MSTPPTAALLAIGTELTDGTVQDSHGRFLSGLLHQLGIETRSILLIPDNLELFVSEVKRLTETHDLVVVTGGLGPTSDDLTREVIARVAAAPLEFHEELWQAIEARFSGRPVSSTNRRQAEIPRGFSVIPNPYGTAPGFYGRVANGQNSPLLVVLPGPPRELRPLAQEVMVPVVEREFGVHGLDELRATVFLLSESLLEQMLQETRQGAVEWGTRAEPYRIVVTLRGGTREEREGMLHALERAVGTLRFLRGEVDLPELVVKSLTGSHLTLAAAESCTGGLVGALVTEVAGASECFWGSVVSYSNAAKEELLAVPEAVLAEFGAVSAETVAAMAHGVLERSGADIGCSISGIAGPSGGSEEKPVGTVWIGVALRDGSRHELHFRYSGDRAMVRRKAAVAALLICLGTLQGKEVDNMELWQYI